MSEEEEEIYDYEYEERPEPEPEPGVAAAAEPEVAAAAAPAQSLYNLRELADSCHASILSQIESSKPGAMIDSVSGELKGNIKTVFREVKNGFSPDSSTTVQDKFGSLMENRDYRSAMAVFSDLIYLLVDTMAEAGVDVFGRVPGSTKAMQEMIRKCFHLQGIHSSSLTHKAACVFQSISKCGKKKCLGAWYT